MGKKYSYRQLIRCSGVFRDIDNEFYDPSTVLFKYKDPDGNITTLTYGSDPEVIKEDIGKYYVELFGDIVGDWTYYFEGVGDTTDEETFTIKSSVFA